MREDLAREAYRAWADHLGWQTIQGEPIPIWESTTLTIRDAWCAAIRVVAEQMKDIVRAAVLDTIEDLVDEAIDEVRF